MTSDRTIHSLRFNQDQGLFSCSMESGLRIYNVDPLVEKLHYEFDIVGSVSQCELVFRTNVFGVVYGGSRPKWPDNILHLYDDTKKKPFFQIKFPSSIRAVRMRKDKIVVALLNSITVYKFIIETKEVKELLSLETRENSRGLCEFSPLESALKQVVIFPGHKLGSVQIVDVGNTESGVSSAPIYIPAHKNDLACLALNQQGTRIATASVQGTLIRVWDTASRTMLIELRRGSDPATVYCINFSRDTDYLCCSSDKGTVHIFAIKDTHLNKRIGISKNVSGILGKYGESHWSLASFTVSAECAGICAFGQQKAIYALCLDGTYHKYNFNNEGSCNREAYDVFLDADDDDDDFWQNY